MDSVDTARIRRRMDRNRIERLVGDLVPHAQAVLVDWSRDLVAEDGTGVSAYRHAWTRKEFFLTDDGRLFHYDEHRRIVEDGDSVETVRRVLPSRRDWLLLGGYAPGDLLGEPLLDEELAN